MSICLLIHQYDRMIEVLPELGAEHAFFQYCYQSSPEFWEALLRASGKKSLNDVQDRILFMGSDDYRRIRQRLNLANITERIGHAMERCRLYLPLVKEPSVYLAFGFRCVGAGTLDDVRGEPAIYFGLEFFGDEKLLDKVPVWLAHEYCHMAWLQHHQGRILRTLKENLIFEGMAVAFAERIYPDYPPNFSNEQIEWLETHEKALWETAALHLDCVCEGAIHHLYFDSTLDGWLPDGTPAKRGYFLGYRLVRHALERAHGDFRTLIGSTCEELWAAWQSEGTLEPS